MSEPNPTPTPPPAGASGTASSVDELRRQVRGPVLEPTDAGYAEAVAAWNLATVQAPAVVVEAEDAADISAAVRYAAHAGLGIGVQCTGHGAVSPVDGLLITTRRLNHVTVDPVARTADVGAGCTSGEVLAAAQAHGLAPLIGGSPTVGAVGFTLGGGVGWLSRRYGVGCDAVRRFEVVTPDGALVHASADENRELFDALRGGGGGALGVVTAMAIDLFPVTTVYAGNLVYPASDAVDVVETYAEWIEQAPDDLTSSVVFMNMPPLPEIPEPLRGKSFLFVRGCWSGDVAEGERFVDAFRAMAPPAIDQWAELSFADSAAISGDPVDPMPAVGTGGWLTELDDEVATIIAAHTFPTDGPPPVVFTEVRHLGGAVTRNAGNGSVMANRDGQFLFSTIALPTDHAGQSTATPAPARLLPALEAHRSPATYTNFLDGEARRAATGTSTVAARHAELAALQRRLDPHDLLRYGVDHVAD